MSVIGTLAVRIVGDTSHLSRSLNVSDASIKRFARNAGIALAGVATTFTVFMKRTIDSMDAMSKMAQRAGVSTQAMSELAHAAELSGLSTQQLTQTLGILSRRMVDASQGSAQAKASFDALRLDVTQFETADEALMAVAERFATLPDGIQKTALAAQLFGDRVGRQLLPFLNQGAKGIEELREEARRLGVAFGDDAGRSAEQFNDNLARLQAIGRAVFIEIANSWIPTVNRYVEAFFAAHKATNSLFRAFAAVSLGALPQTLSEFSHEIAITEAELGKLQQRAAQIDAGNLDDLFGRDFLTNLDLDKQIETLQARLTMLKTLAEMQQTRAAGLTDVVFPDVAIGGAAVRSGSDPLAERLEAVKQITKEFERERQFQLEMMQIQDQMLGMTRDEQAVQEVMNRVLQETDRNLQQIADKRLEAANLGANQQILDQFDKEAAKVQELADEYAHLAETQKRAAIEAQRQFSFGWNTAFAQYAEDATNAATVARDMFTSMTSNINNAISNLVDTGKLSFSDLASSIIKDIIRIQLQAQVSQAFSQIIGIIGGAVGGMFTASAGATTIGAGSTAGGAGALSFPVNMGSPQARAFAAGGYTGHGGQFEPAGIVHRGEYVLNAAATRRIGVGNLERMNRGFASGGYAGGSMGGGVNINIKNEAGADGYKATAQTRTNSDGGLNIDVLVRRVVSADIQNNGALAQQMANTFGLRRSI